MALIPTILCDACDTHYMLEASDGQDLPPSWFAVQIVIADSEGVIPMHERDVFLHFCSQECMVDYIKSDTFKERTLMADRFNEESEGGGTDVSK